jgi:hypothetical protein
MKAVPAAATHGDRMARRSLLRSGPDGRTAALVVTVSRRGPTAGIKKSPGLSKEGRQPGAQYSRTWRPRASVTCMECGAESINPGKCPKWSIRRANLTRSDLSRLKGERSISVDNRPQRDVALPASFVTGIDHSLGVPVRPRLTRLRGNRALVRRAPGRPVTGRQGGGAARRGWPGGLLWRARRWLRRSGS